MNDVEKTIKTEILFDKVPVLVMQSVNEMISTIMFHIINSSFISGWFPDKLKISKCIKFT